MGGRAILLLVSGFSLLFLTLGQRFTQMTTQSVTNYTKYYAHSISHNIAVSGANLAVNQIYFAPSWNTGYTNVSMNGGTMTAVVVVNPVTKAITLTVKGVYSGDTSTVIVDLQITSFAKYAYCSNNENGIWWANQDSVNGPFHTQDYLNVNGHPVFNPGANCYVGTYKGINKYNTSSSPTIIGPGTLRLGDSLVIPQTGVAKFDSIATAGGYAFTGHDTVYVALAGDSLRYRFAYNAAWTTRLDTTFAPNRTIIAHNAILRLQGTLKGKLTIGASGSSFGTVYLDDDVVYYSDPKTNPNSTDLLGIVAQNNIYVANNSTTNNIHIDAALFAQSGGFGAESYQSRNPSGYIYLLGGITQYGRQAVGQLDGNGNLTHGFSKNYTYDSRLLANVPPSFPSTNSYTVISWYE